MGIMTRITTTLLRPRVMLQPPSTYAARAGSFVPRWEQDKPQWLPSTIRNYDHEAYRKITLIFSCVQYLSHAAGTAPLRIYNPADRAQDRHPFRQLIERPNPHMGESRFLSFIAMNMAVTNFVVIEKERDRIGNVVGLWPLRSDWLRPIPRNQDAPDWEYHVPGYTTPIRLDATDVILITWADTPDWRSTGIGPMEAVLREAQVSSALTDFLKVFMDRGAMPLYMLLPSDDPTIGAQLAQPGVKDAFMAAWRQRYGGLINSSVEPLLSPGIKDIKRVGLDFNELAYPELNNLADARICQAFGVPAILVGAEVGLERSTFSNSEQAERNFYGGTMPRLWSRIDDAFTRDLLPEFETRNGWDIRFDVSDIAALQENTNDIYARITAAFTAGLISRTVAQMEIGIEPHGADVFHFPLIGPVSVESDDGLPERAPEAPMPEGEPAAEEPAEEPVRMIVAAMERRYVNVGILSQSDLDLRARRATNRRAAILRHANHATPILSRYLAGQRERVVTAVSEGLAGGARLMVAERERRALQDFDWTDEMRQLELDLGPWLKQVGADAFATTAAETATDDAWTISNAWLERLDGQLAKRIVGITNVTRADVERVVTEALHEGTDIPGLADRLRGLYDETYAGRSSTIARTESQVAYNTATTLGYEASGVVQDAELFDNPLHDTDPGSDGLTCAERNGLIVPLAQVNTHIEAEHPNGTLAVGAVITTPEGSEG